MNLTFAFKTQKKSNLNYANQYLEPPDNLEVCEQSLITDYIIPSGEDWRNPALNSIQAQEER